MSNVVPLRPRGGATDTLNRRLDAASADIAAAFETYVDALLGEMTDALAAGVDRPVVMLLVAEAIKGTGDAFVQHCGRARERLAALDAAKEGP